MNKNYQLKDPKEVEKKMIVATDGLGLDIDKGILRSIVILNSLGFETRQSCEGHDDRYETYPWIDLTWKESKKDDLNIFFESIFKDLEDFYSNRSTDHKNKIIMRCFFSDPLNVRLCNSGTLKIFDNNRSEVRKNFLNEINEFCEFLNKKYKLNY